MKVLVTGATGFVGSHIIKRVRADGCDVRALVRKDAPEWLQTLGAEITKGDVTDASSLMPACLGADAVVHCVGLINEIRGETFEKIVALGTRRLLDAAVRAEVKKIVYISAMGASLKAKSRYHKTKWAAEEACRRSGLTFTVLRPSIIFGPEDKFINLFAGKLVPFPGGGVSTLQPIYIEDVAAIVSKSLTQGAGDNQTFELGGPERMTMRSLIAIAERIFGVKGRHPGIPAGFTMFAAKLLLDHLQRIGIVPPVTSDQLLMMSEPNSCTEEELERTVKTFGIELTPLKDGLREYADLIKR